MTNRGSGSPYTVVVPTGRVVVSISVAADRVIVTSVVGPGTIVVSMVVDAGSVVVEIDVGPGIVIVVVVLVLPPDFCCCARGRRDCHVLRGFATSGCDGQRYIMKTDER